MVRNPNPTADPAATSHQTDAFVEVASTARTTAYPPATSSNVSSASGLSNRNISTAAGVSASAAPASSPAPGPAQRRTAPWSSPTDATPASACGTSRLHELNPKIRALAVISHSAAGGLSTVMALAWSRDPNSHAFHDSVPALTAAA